MNREYGNSTCPLAKAAAVLAAVGEEAAVAQEEAPEPAEAGVILTAMLIPP